LFILLGRVHNCECLGLKKKLPTRLKAKMQLKLQRSLRYSALFPDHVSDTCQGTTLQGLARRWHLLSY